MRPDEICTPPPGSLQTEYLLFRNGQLTGSTGEETPARCRWLEIELDQATDDEIRARLAEQCGDTDFSDWQLRRYESENGRRSINGAVRSEAAIHILISESYGGMPGGALRVDRWLLALPPSDLPIVECISRHYSPPYHGPMPP